MHGKIFKGDGAYQKVSRDYKYIINNILRWIVILALILPLVYKSIHYMLYEEAVSKPIHVLYLFIGSISIGAIVLQYGVMFIYWLFTGHIYSILRAFFTGYNSEGYLYRNTKNK